MEHRTDHARQGKVPTLLVNRLQKPTSKAIDYALAAKHDKTLAVHVAITEEESAKLQKDWAEHEVPIPLVIIDSPYRTYTSPVSAFIKRYREKNGSAVVTVYLPQYIVGHWWESILHNRRSRRLAQQLMLVHGVSITLVPWLLASSERSDERRVGKECRSHWLVLSMPRQSSDIIC